MTIKKETFVISGKAFWAHVRKPNELSGKLQLDLSIDDATASLLKDKGVSIKKEDNEKHLGTVNDRGNYVTLKRSVVTKDGTKISPLDIVDAKRNKVAEDLAIGNGSQVNVATNVYDWTFKGKKGKALGLEAVQIKTLVSYNKSSSTDSFSEIDGGYEAETKEEIVSHREDPEDLFKLD